MPPEQEKSPPSLESMHLERRKRQVARRLRRICPGIRENELADIVDRIARIELQHDLAQGFSYEALDSELASWPIPEA